MLLLPILSSIAVSCAPVGAPSSQAEPASAPTMVPDLVGLPTTHALNGMFTSRFQDGPKPVRAVFTVTERELQWEVVFHFEFNGARHRYRGTAEGSLRDGSLHGRVRNDNRQRTFTFSGDMVQGAFQGSHAEVRNGIERSTGGTLTLREG